MAVEFDCIKVDDMPPAPGGMRRFVVNEPIRWDYESAMAYSPTELDDSVPPRTPTTPIAPTAPDDKLATAPRPHSRFVLGTHSWAFLMLVALYVLPGLAGHEPWKQDEAYIMDIVHNMLATGDVIVPRVAGETFMEKPPLFYWVAGALATIAAPMLTPHDGARLAVGCFILLTCAAMA